MHLNLYKLAAASPLLLSLGLMVPSAETAKAEQSICRTISDVGGFLLNAEKRKGIKNVTQKYSNGVYVGSVANGRRCGNGTYYFNNGTIKVGGWDGSLFKGTTGFSDGTIYHGEFEQNGNLTEGTIVYRSGAVYRGAFAQGKWAGKKGKYLSKSGVIYYGAFSGGDFNGHGLQCGAKNEYIYIGNFTNDEPHGEGGVKFAGGTAFEGVWNKGNPVFGVGNYKGKDSVFVGRGSVARGRSFKGWCQSNGYRSVKACIKVVSRKAALDKLGYPHYPGGFSECNEHRIDLQLRRKSLLEYVAREKAKRP